MRRAHDIDDGELTTIDSLRALIGDAALSQLSGQFGGTRIYVPATLGAHHPITVTVGQDAANQLATAFAGQQLVVPITPARRSMILELDREGWTRAKIARKVGLTDRRVYQVLEDERRRGPKIEPKGSLL